MPHLRFRGGEEADLSPLLPDLMPGLAEVFGCPADWITVEAVATRFLTPAPGVFLEILWFDRGQSVRDAVVRVVAETFAARGRSIPTVVFLPVAKNEYYEDGRHFG